MRAQSRRIENMREHTYPKWHVSKKKVMFDPTPGKRAKLVDSLGHIRVKLISQVLRRLSDISGFHYFSRSQFRGGREGGVGTMCVLQYEKFTSLIASAMTCSSTASRASMLSVPPSAARSLSTAVSVTSSLVCERGHERNECHDSESVEKSGTRPSDKRVEYLRVYLLPLGCVATHHIHWWGTETASP